MTMLAVVTPLGGIETTGYSSYAEKMKNRHAPTGLCKVMLFGRAPGLSHPPATAFPLRGCQSIRPLSRHDLVEPAAYTAKVCRPTIIVKHRDVLFIPLLPCAYCLA